MGGNQSRTFVQETRDFINEQTTEILNEMKQTASATGEATNTLDFTGAEFTDCRFAATQTIDASAIAQIQLSSDQTNSIADKLAAAINDKIDQTASQENGFLNTSVANDVDAVTDLKEKVKNVIQTTISNKTVQDAFAQMKATNAQNFSGFHMKCNPKYRERGACGKNDQTGCDFYVDQNAKVAVMATVIADQTTKNLFDNDTINNATSDIQQSSDQENSGIEAAIKALFDGIRDAFTGPLAAVWIAAVIMCCLCCCGLLVFLLSPGGQHVATVAANTGSKAAFA